METSELFAIIVFGLVVVAAATAGILAIRMILRDLLARRQKPPIVARRMRLKPPKTRPLIYGGWERQIKPDDDDRQAGDG